MAGTKRQQRLRMLALFSEGPLPQEFARASGVCSAGELVASQVCRPSWIAVGRFAPRTVSRNRWSGFVEDALVVGFVGGDDVVSAEFFLGVDAGDFAHFAAAVGARQDFDGIAGGFLHVAGLY